MKKYIITFFSLLLFSLATSQTKDQLKKQNADLRKQIANINSTLAKTRSESKLSIAYLTNVNKKIQLREKVYSNTQKEKRFIEDDIYLRQLEINRQNKELKVLRKNYANVLVNVYKNKGIQNKVTFILSSKSIGEAMRRVQYLKRYAEYQDRKATEISNAATLLKKSLTERQKSIKQKEILLANQQTELSTINAEKLQKEKLLQDFKKNETRLIAELNQKEIQSKILQGKIRNIIEEEIRIAKANEAAIKKAEEEKIRLAKIAAEKEKARIDAENKAKAEALEKARIAAEKEAKKAAELAAKKAEDEKRRTEEAAKAEASIRDETKRLAAEKASKEAAENARLANEKVAIARKAENDLNAKNEAAKKAAEVKALTNYGVTSTSSTNFESARGNMNMPVSGNITHRFGREQHPIFKNIVSENMGIKIATKKGSTAKCVFPGTVSKVQDNGDGTRTIIIKHGIYYSIYTNMKSASVSQGDKVSDGTTLGVVGEDFDGSTTLEFQIWKGTNPIDPSSWLR